MRKIIGFVLLALGAALFAVGIVTTAWAPGVIKQTPLDVDTTTHLTGEASYLGSEMRPIKITSLTRVDSDASAKFDKAVFVQTQCVVFTDAGDVADCPSDKTDPRVISIGEPDRFVTDRKTALAVSEDGIIDAQYVTAHHEGIVNKFPFDTEQKTYPYWDGTTARAWDATFVGTEDIQGVQTYHFSVTIADVQAEVAPDVQGTYSNKVDMWVEPKTGAIINQEQSTQRAVDGTTVLDLTAAFTDDQVKTFADDAKTNTASLAMVTKTMPLVGFVGGALLLLAGAALILTGRRKPDAGTPVESAPRQPALV